MQVSPHDDTEPGHDDVATTQGFGLQERMTECSYDASMPSGNCGSRAPSEDTELQSW